MNCIKHPESPSAGTCEGCAKLLGARCLVAMVGPGDIVSLVRLGMGSLFAPLAGNAGGPVRP